jgi:diguanylate cyclase (GGDEF)-like protein
MFASAAGESRAEATREYLDGANHNGPATAQADCTYRPGGTQGVTSSRIEWASWLRAIPQGTTYLGLAMVALIWGAVEFHLDVERDRSEATAIQGTGNLARVFEEQITRTIKANDRILRSLQLASVNGTLLADFDRWAREVNESGDFTLQLGLIDANGLLFASSLGPLAEAFDLGDRDYFKAHRDSTETGLVVGKPIIGRKRGKWSIPLTRALRGPDGDFAGVVFASLSADGLAEFYGSLDLGRDGAIMVVGLDGIVRAGAGMRADVLGKPIPGSRLMHHLQIAAEGFYLSRGQFDGIRRIISYRAVKGFPLALWVGRAERDVLENYWRNGYSYRLAAAGISVFILIVVIVNVSARKKLRASEGNARAKARELELTLDHMSQGIIMVDAQQRVALMNRQAVTLLGLPEDLHARPQTFDELVAHQWASGEFGPDGAAVEPEVRESIKAGSASPILTIYERTRPNGIVLEVRSADLPDGGFVRTFTDISRRKRNEDKIAYLAHHDALTGLANRVLLSDRIAQELARQRRQGEELALLLIDLDRFKQVNDTLGHAAGDVLLRQVGERLRGCVREIDMVARVGGDEFAILQIGVDARGGDALARRVIEVLSAPYDLNGHRAEIGASIGIARSRDSAGMEGLFHNADLALYRVKSEGRNGFRLFQPEMDAQAQARHQMEADLRTARERGEFEIYYQPIFCLATGSATGAEALLRWNHPQRGRISPAEFMPLAEEIGVMVSIDAWVLQTATREAACWPGDVRIAVNMSPAKFKRHNLVDVVRAALADSGLAPQRLELEISERTMLQEDGGNIEILHLLHDLGVRISLDDFGTGYSSLGDLRLFAFDKIKIDQSFIADLEMATESVAIVAAIAALGRNLGAETTAEGVETAAQAKIVRAAGCTEAQGYLYSRPVTAMAIRALLREGGAERAAVA